MMRTNAAAAGPGAALGDKAVLERQGSFVEGAELDLAAASTEADQAAGPQPQTPSQGLTGTDSLLALVISPTSAQR